MRIIKYFVFLNILLFAFCIQVNALNCDSEDIARLKILANDIEINYVYNEDVYDSYGMREYDTYKVVVSNISNELYLIEDRDNMDLRDYSISDGQIVIDRMYSGKKKFKVYSSECNKFIKSIYVDLPKFNYYSTDPNCDGKEDLDVCHKFYDTSELEYSEFYNIVFQYENGDNEVNNDIDDDSVNVDDDKKNDINKYIEIIKDNYIYIGIGIGVLVILIIVLLILRHKKRGVLE